MADAVGNGPSLEDEPTHPALDRRSPAHASLRLRQLSASFTCDDLAKSVRLYIDGLGFTVKERWEEEGKLLGVMLIAGACELGLSQDDWSKGRERKKGIGCRLWATTVDDLEALAKRARAVGLTVDGPKTEPWGARTVAVTDPDGFQISFSHAE